MTIQTGLGAEVVFAREGAFGVEAAPGAGTILRRVASTLAMTRQGQRSNEIRADAQLAAWRAGSRRVQGEIRAELALGSAEALLAAALRGDWAPGATMVPGTAVTAHGEGRRFVRASGSWIGDGFRSGDVVRWSGLSAGNDARSLRIVALSDVEMAVAETVEDAQAAAAACVVPGRKLVMGTAAPSFTIEHAFDAAGFSQLFTGCRIGGLELSLAPGRMAELSLPVVGRAMDLLEGAAAPHFAAPAPPPATMPLAAVDATLRVDGRDVGVATALELVVDLNLAGDPVVGAETVPNIFYGRSIVTGSLTVFVEDAMLLDRFAAGAETALHLLLAPKGGAGFLALHLPRLVFTGGDLRLQGAEGLPLRLPFQALVQEGDAAADAATMTMQAADD